MLLEDDEEIILHYEVTVPKYNIEYVIKGNTEGGSVTGKTLVKEAENVTFRVLTNPGYRVKNVTVNGNNIRLDANGDYQSLMFKQIKLLLLHLKKLKSSLLTIATITFVKEEYINLTMAQLLRMAVL